MVGGVKPACQAGDESSVCASPVHFAAQKPLPPEIALRITGDCASVVSSTDLYTETGDAPRQPGAKNEHIGHMRARQDTSSAPSRDAASVECIDLLNSPH